MQLDSKLNSGDMSGSAIEPMCFCGNNCTLGCAYSCTGPCSGSCGLCGNCGSACHTGGVCNNFSG